MAFLCPYCNKVTNIVQIGGTIAFAIRGINIAVDVECFVCCSCFRAYEKGSASITALEVANHRYREIMGMVQPNEVTIFRKEFGLSRNGLAAKLDWDINTLVSFENGGLLTENENAELSALMLRKKGKAVGQLRG